MMSMTGTIAKIIREYWESELPEVKDRELEAHLEEPLISDIVGPRRAGKTYLMFLLIKKLMKKHSKEETIYINFENRKLLPLRGEYFNEIVEFIHGEQLLDKHGKVFLFLDEVQRVDGWERYVRSVHDEFKDKIKVLVSGSSADLLSKEYSRLLTGRHLTTTVLPLSFREYLSFNGLSIKGLPRTEREEALVKKHLRQYMTYGGFPEIVLGGDKESMISQLFTDIVARDILSRTDVRNKNVIEEFANYLASNISNLLSFGKMARYFKSRGIKVSVPTLIKYFEHMKDAFLFFDNSIFSYKIKDQMQYPRKIFSIDNGIASIAGSYGEEKMGAMCENTVAVELLRRKAITHYWRAPDGSEVDFVVRKGKAISPIQVCYRIDSAGTQEREVKALVKCLREFRVKEGRLITFDYEGVETADGKRIVYTPLWKFLLAGY